LADDHTRIIQDLDERLESKEITNERIEEKIDDLTKELEEAKGEIKYLKAEGVIEKRLRKELAEAQLKSECQERRNNIRFVGIAESPTELTWEDAAKRIREIIKNQLQIDPDDIEFVRCHRIGRAPTTADQRPRPVICMFAKWADRNRIFSKRALLKNSGIKMTDDFPQEIIRRRNILNPVLTAIYNHNDTHKDEPRILARIAVDRLIINSENFTINNLHQIKGPFTPTDLATKTVGNNIYYYTLKSPYSNHYPSPFSLGGVNYDTLEHYFMAEKARHFTDPVALAKILVAPSAAAAKSLGKTVKPFRRREWATVAPDKIQVGVEAKFEQNE
jgi:hypothetical protein